MIAALAEVAHRDGLPFKIGVITGASTGASLDGALCNADAISFRTPYHFGLIRREMWSYLANARLMLLASERAGHTVVSTIEETAMIGACQNDVLLWL